MAPDPARHPRRRFLQGGLVLAGLGLLSSCNAARLPWQQPARVPRLGYLGAGLLGPYPALLNAFREGLRELDYAELFRCAATYVDKILKGARPADLPVEQPTKLEFVINLRTAQALELSIPQSVLQQATELIQ